MANRIPLKGNFREQSIAGLLIYLNRSRLTGTLVVEAGAFLKKVFFDKGDAIFASSTSEDDRLGEMLLKAGKITVEQYERSVELLMETGKRQGTILVELGYLNPKDLYWGVKFQVREIIYSLFMIEDARYEFLEGEVPTAEVITLKMSMGNLIYEGVRRIDKWTRIRNEMPNVNEVLVMSDDPFNLFQDVELSDNDRKVLAGVDGRKTVKEVTDSSGVGPFEALKTLYVLRSIGLLTVSTGAGAEKAMSISIDDLLGEIPAEEVQIGRKVQEFMEKAPTANFFEVLEASPDDDVKTIEENYYRLTKEFHPDKHYGSENGALKDRLHEVFDRITFAYNHLNSQGKIAAYRKRLQAGAALTRGGTPRPQGSKDAPALYRQGVKAFKNQQYEGAAAHFREAIDQEPRNAKYWSYLSLALSKIPSMGKEAEEALLEAMKIEPDNADFLVNLGVLLSRRGQRRRAMMQFEKALTLEPGNQKAQKGLRDLKRGAGKGKGG